MHKILVVDDDVQMIGLLTQLLEREGYGVLATATADDALALIEHCTPDLFIIDVNLPDMDGLSFCRLLRESSRFSYLPILFITGDESPISVSAALEAGGDDFIRKPFAVRELAARLRALLRRSNTHHEVASDLPSLQIYPDMRLVLVDDRLVDLTQVEFELLRYLCTSPSKLHSTHDLLRNVWNYPADAGDAALVRNHIRNLRRKLETNPDRPAIIQSRHGRGYTVKADIHIREGEPPRLMAH